VYCEASGGGSSQFYSLTYEHDFDLEFDIPTDFARVAYSSSVTCGTISAANTDITAGKFRIEFRTILTILCTVAEAELGSCLGFYEGSASAIKLGGCENSVNALTFQYYDISSTCSYNTPISEFGTTCAEVRDGSGVDGVGACPNLPLFGIPATPVDSGIPSATPTMNNEPVAPPTQSNAPQSNGPTATSPTAANTPTNTPVKPSNASAKQIALASFVAGLLLFV
jgi:hypothetical protein